MANYQGSRTGQQIDDGVGASAGSGTGIMIKTGTGTGTRRTLTGTANRISVTNGDGISGNPTLDISTLNHLDFMKNSASSNSEGRIKWNDTAKTLEIGTSNNGTILVGQEEFFRARGKENITAGQAVYISGFSANTPEVNLAQADSQLTSDSVGIATVNINNNAFGKVVFSGIVGNLNTAAFNIGDRLFISHETKGLLTNVRPPPPFCNVSVGIVIEKNSTTGKIIVSPSRTPRFRFLCDVDTDGANTTGQFPVWDNTDGYFKFSGQLNDLLPKSDIVDNLTTNDSTKVLSSAQGKILKGLVDKLIKIPTGNSLGTSGTVNLNMQTLNATYQTIVLDGDISFTTTNRASGKRLTLRLIENADNTRNIVFPAEWTFVGVAPSATLKDEVAIIEIIFFGTSESDCVASMKISV